MNKITGLFLNGELSDTERGNMIDEISGCINRICVTHDLNELITMEMSINYKIGILIKNRIIQIADNGEASAGAAMLREDC